MARRIRRQDFSGYFDHSEDEDFDNYKIRDTQAAENSDLTALLGVNSATDLMDLSRTAYFGELNFAIDEY